MGSRLQVGSWSSCLHRVRVSPVNIYVDLTHEFNAGGLVAVLSSGQAVVLHRLAIMSKDGDWILREDPDALRRVLTVLAQRGAAYRFGAPLDVRWMRGGWSAHLEFRLAQLRVRTDFVTSPPRLSGDDVQRMWLAQSDSELPFIGVRDLIELKKTNREKDYAVIGELARLLPTDEEQLLCSRSARDILAIASRRADLVDALERQRPVLRAITGGRDALEAALDAERRSLMHANEERLARYVDAAEAWLTGWPGVCREIAGLPLPEAHTVVVERALGVLPFSPEEET